MSIPVDHNYIIEILSNLVRINSVNPSLSKEGQGEAQIGVYVAEVLYSLGLDVNTYEIQPGRVNIIGKLRGTGQGRSLLLNAHLDTVGVEGMVIDPFDPKIKNGRLYGRGAQDMKGSLAAMIGAIKALVDSGIQLNGDLLVTAVADEEYISIGMQDLVRRVNADAAIVTEPTDLTIGRAHRGFIWYDVETYGRAAHGSRFQEGIDANIRMGRFLAELDMLEKDLRYRTPHHLVGPPSLHAARLKGGTEISTYAAHCLLQIERRTTPGETEEQATEEIQAIIDLLTSQDPTFKATLSTTLRRDPFEIHSEAPIVQILEKAAAERIGLSPAHTGQSFWTDAALLADAGIQTVLFGPKGHGLHSEIEWVDIDSILEAASILANTALLFCG